MAGRPNGVSTLGRSTWGRSNFGISKEGSEKPLALRAGAAAGGAAAGGGVGFVPKSKPPKPPKLLGGGGAGSAGGGGAGFGPKLKANGGGDAFVGAGGGGGGAGFGPKLKSNGGGARGGGCFVPFACLAAGLVVLPPFFADGACLGCPPKLKAKGFFFAAGGSCFAGFRPLAVTTPRGAADHLTTGMPAFGLGMRQRVAGCEIWKWQRRGMRATHGLKP